jgi:uncharacterized membrane protein YgcG
VPARPISVTIAAAVESLEGIAIIGAGGYVAWETIVGQPRDLPSAIALAVIAIITGVLIVLVGRGLLQARRWSRAPAVITQMFVLIVAVPMVQGDQGAIGLPLVVGAVVGMVVLLMPETAQALAEDARPHDADDADGGSDGPDDSSGDTDGSGSSGDSGKSGRSRHSG